MRQSFLVLVLVLAFAACVQGLTNNENAALSVNHETTIAKSNRNLKEAAQLLQALARRTRRGGP
ncbi:hypothetical protein GQ600_23211 [Phytophthora cactorum]|nr:hypothetical protein GQ600_23211 [Phytophthora cactorum]